MHHEQYTPDAICRSMGLPAFVEPGWSPVTLRVLLNPSFDPEVCLTLSGSHDDTRLSVVALAEMLWHQPWPRPMATRREEISVPASVLRDALEAFGPAATAARERQPVCLDGMSLVACLQAEAESSRFECNVFAAAAVFEFAAILVRSAWNSCRESAVRNALATCGRYVGLDLPQEPVPKVPEPYRISVLGTPDARAEFFGLLPSHGERGIP